MLYDRVLKAELMNSDRWLDLPSDSHRLAYVCLLPLADDFGNFEAGGRRLWRWLHARTQVKDESHATKVISDLMDADMIRHYRVAEVDYWHIARFECDRRYVCRRVPGSPWDDTELERRAKHYRAYHAARRVDSKAKLEKSDHEQTMNRPLTDPVQGLGVGVGVGEKKKKRARVCQFVLPDWVPAAAWAAWEEMRVKSHKPLTDAARVVNLRRLERLRDDGHPPLAVIEKATGAGWAGFYPLKPGDVPPDETPGTFEYANKHGI